MARICCLKFLLNLSLISNLVSLFWGAELSCKLLILINYFTLDTGKGEGKRDSKDCFKVIKNRITMFSKKDDRINVLEMVIENSLCIPLVLLITTFITSNGFLHVHTDDAKTINTSNEL